MGTYVYKVSSHTVELSNGEIANVAICAYKPTYNMFANTSNEQMHFRSGAARCDAYADQRSDWIVEGFKNADGKIEVELDAIAKKVGRRGSYEDSWFDMKTDVETSAVAAALSREIVLVRTKQVMITDTEGEYISYAYNRKSGWKETGRQKFFVGKAA